MAFARVPAGFDIPDEAWRLDSRDMEAFTPSEMGAGITFKHDMVTSTPDIDLGTVGFCIYCGASTNQPGINKPCADEHVIPKGLGGKLILRKASCLSCANAVGVYEGNLLRNLFHVPRRALSIRSRKHRPQPITISTIVDGEEVVTELPVDMHPGTLMMPSLYLPQMMSFNDRIYQGVQKVWTYKLNDKGFSGGSGLQNYLSPELDLLKFGQLLTKIAYSYSMSYQTIKAFTFDREPIITDKSSPLAVFARTIYPKDVYPLEFYQFVGGFSERFKRSEHLHRIGHGYITARGLLFDVVYIWLFANMGAPVYCIITDYSIYDGPLPPNSQ